MTALIPEKYTPPFGYDLTELNQFATSRRYEEGSYTLSEQEVTIAVQAAETIHKWASDNVYSE